MKATLYDSQGNKKSDITLPKVFDSKVREDLSAKYFEIKRNMSMFLNSTFDKAGKRHSASGTISHRRHEWQGHYGKGMARLPRKTMWRRGSQFHWIGAEVSQTKGGRVAHPPLGRKTPKRLNKKEETMAFASALAATMDSKKILLRYPSLAAKGKEVSSAVIESLPTKAKDLQKTLKLIFKNAEEKILKERSVRPGKGKLRNRKYKSTTPVLIVKSKDENLKFTRIDIINAKEIKIQDIYPLGRIVLYTEKALKEMEAKK